MELLETEAEFRGDIRGWLAGLIYAVNNDGRYACGVDGVSNAEFTAAFGVTMSTVYSRAAAIKQKLVWTPM